MSSAIVPIQKTLVNEGGYAPSFGVNGETYKGIDRKQQPNWPGWRIIDQYKRNSGVRKYQVIKNVQLDTFVYDFYHQNFWKKSKAELLNNQTFANNYFDFYFHKPAIAMAALMEAAGKNNLNDAIAAANENENEVYAMFYYLRIQHYKNKWMNGTGKNRIYYAANGTQQTQLRRAQSYPATLSGFVGVKN